MILPYNDKEKKKAHEYYLKNKKAIRKKQEEYREKNRERINQNDRERRVKHPEKYRAYQRNWQRNNTNKTQRYHQTYRSKPGIREKELAKNLEKIVVSEGMYCFGVRLTRAIFVLSKNRLDVRHYS